MKMLWTINRKISTYFSAPDDLRGPGSVNHLGTGPVNTMYILVRDYTTGELKIFLGPTYSTYDFITDSKKMLDDMELEKRN